MLLLLQTDRWLCAPLVRMLDYNNMGQIRMKKPLVNTDERCLLQSLSLMQLLDYKINKFLLKTKK